MQTDIRNRLLYLLKAHRSAFLSGEKLSSLLGVTRTTVWKHIEALRRRGYVIEATTNQGYRLHKIPDLLRPEEISYGLQAEFCGKKIYYFPTVASTNLVAHALGTEGEEEGTLVVAEEQTSGRGRRGRGWHSVKGKGIWISLLLYPRSVRPEQAAPFTAAVAVAVSRILALETKSRPTIKWPNDLLLNGKKVGGILAEIKGNEEEVHYLVLGIGLNINQGGEHFPPDLTATATSLYLEESRIFDRASLCRRLLEELEKSYLLFLKEGFAPFREPWIQNSATLGKKIKVSRGNGYLEGTAKELDNHGALLVEDGSGVMHRITYGEITSQSPPRE